MKNFFGGTVARRRIPEPERSARGIPERQDRQPRAPQVQRVEGEPEPPTWFDSRTLGIWQHLCAVLRNRGQLTLDNRWALAALTCAVNDWQAMQADIAQNGSTYYLRGVEKIRPAAKLMNETDHQLRMWLGEFGLTDVTFQAI